MADRQRKHPPPRGRTRSADLADRTHAEQIQLATYGISEAVHAAPTLLDLFRAIHGIVGELMPAKNLYIALHDAATDTLSFPYYVDEYDPRQPPKRAGRGLTEYVIRTGQPLLADEGIHRELERRGRMGTSSSPDTSIAARPVISPPPARRTTSGASHRVRCSW